VAGEPRESSGAGQGRTHDQWLLNLNQHKGRRRREDVRSAKPAAHEPHGAERHTQGEWRDRGNEAATVNLEVAELGEARKRLEAAHVAQPAERKVLQLSACRLCGQATLSSCQAG